MWENVEKIPRAPDQQRGRKKFHPQKHRMKKKTNKFITEQAILNVEKFMDDGSMCDDGVEA